jgi:hypothetical protein
MFLKNILFMDGGRYDEECLHPMSRVRKKYSGYWCLLCGRKVKGISFKACHHGLKIGKCGMCRMSQKLICDFDGA